MPELLQEYWILILVALVIGVIVAFWIFNSSRRTTVEQEKTTDASTGAKRNQALIDSIPAAQTDLDKSASHNLIDDNEDAQMMESAAAPGPVSAAANTDAIAAAPEKADAEAGGAAPARNAMKAVPAELAKAPVPAGSQSDDLRRIKGVGPKLVDKLHAEGVDSFAQIASWDDQDIDRIDSKLGRFQGRIRRDDWVEQARLLDAGDTAGYAAKFGNV